MSLSQKHSGKVLVPWFNTAEWKTVYQLIYSNDTVLQKKALEILYVWKIRTPILPSGAEGTLIVLEALLANCSAFSDGEISALYSTAVLRFLNICAASNDRQGTFVKIAKENDIPDWLVSIRHDIAHNSRLPSVAMLKLCLDYCLNWTEEKYWKQQLGSINDFIVNEQKNETRSYSLLYSYIHVNLNLYRGKYYEDLNNELKSTLCTILPKKLRKLSPSLYVLRSYLLDMLLNESDSNYDLKSCAVDIMSDFVQSIILSVYSGTTNTGSKYIPNEFRDMWIDLLKLFINKDVIFNLVHSLFKVTSDILYDSRIRETAATWILEIFNGLLKVKYSTQDQHSGSNEDKFTENHPDLINALDFGHIPTMPLRDARSFLNKILNEPNKVFELIGVSKTAEDVAIKALRSLFFVDDPQHGTDISTIENLDSAMGSKGNDVCNGDANSNGEMSDSKLVQKWKRIDSKKFEGCPLGILPHQDRSQNPLLVL